MPPFQALLEETHSLLHLWLCSARLHNYSHLVEIELGHGTRSDNKTNLKPETIRHWQSISLVSTRVIPCA